jgi:PAS domain S-box-containing protein
MGATSKLTVLNVDDYAAGRYAIGKILQSAGFDVIEASTGKEALRLATKKPALIILDINLPDISGIEVCKRLKANPDTASIPILHMSATYVKGEDKVRGLDNGADGYLTWPVEPFELIASVKSLVRMQQAESALYESEERFRATFEQAAIGIAQVAIDGRFLDVNQKLCDILGYTNDELKKRTFQEITHPEDISVDLDQIRQIIGKEISTFSVEKRFIRRDGFCVWVNITRSTVCDSTGNPLYFISVVEDITYRKGSQIELQNVREELERRVEERTEELAIANEALRSEKKERELLLQQLVVERSRLEAVLQQMPADVLITDDQGEIILVNRQVDKVFQNGEMVSSKIGDYISSRTCHPDGSSYNTGEFPLLRSIRTGEVVAGEEVIFLNDNESRATVRISSSPIRDNSGKIIAAVATFYDITAQKYLLECEQAARAEAVVVQKRLEFLSEASNILASSLDYDTTLKSVARLMVSLIADQCTIYLFENGELQGVAAAHSEPSKAPLLRELQRRYKPNPDNPLSIVSRVFRTRKPEVIIEVTDSLLDSLIEDTELLAISKLIKPKSGIAVPLLVRGRVIGVIALASEKSTNFYKFVDLAFAEELARRAALAVDNARLYREAQEANRLKDDFLATVSHELRTPLTAMLGWTRLVRSGKLEGSTLTRALETIERNAKAQAQLIDDLLDISRIIAGKLRLDFQLVDIVTVIETALDAVRPTAEAKGINLKVNLLRGLDPILGDPSRLQQIVWNLLSNAVKFTPGGGDVEVLLEQNQENFSITVTDTGKGISTEFLPFVFDRFRQADSANTRTFGGLGLGLAIVRHLTELHGGIVQAESEGEGKGATFKVIIPQIGVDQKRHGDTESMLQDEGLFNSLITLEGLRILIVEDEADSRDMIATIITEQMGEARAASSADEALKIMDEWKPHILVSDIGMPGVNGYELMGKIRERSEEEGGRIPSIALTAFARTEDRLRALSAGFNMHVPKPVEPAELITVIANLADWMKIGN